MATVGTGTTITFGTSTFTGEIVDVDAGGHSRPIVDTSHMGTTGYRTKIPGKLVEGGTIDVTIKFAPATASKLPPIQGDPETITITFPKENSASTTAPSVAFTGFVSDWKWGSKLEEEMTGSMTIAVADDPTWTEES